MKIVTKFSQVARLGIKEELTTRDEYLDTVFQGLSESGHDLTPMSPSDVDRWKCVHSESVRTEPLIASFLGYSEKGLYVTDVGGLPLFASGSRIDALCNKRSLVFTEPCDPKHVYSIDAATAATAATNSNDEPESGKLLFCTRCRLNIGKVVLRKSGEVLYVLNPQMVRFLPLNTKWPVESQPENFWGSEGQYRSWNNNELISRPLSY